MAWKFLQIGKANAEIDRLNGELAKVTKERDTAILARDQVKSKLENELDVERKERKNLETGYASEKKDARDAVASMNATQKNAADNRKE